MLYTRSAGPPVVFLLIFVKAVRHEDKLDAVNEYIGINFCGVGMSKNSSSPSVK